MSRYDDRYGGVEYINREANEPDIHENVIPAGLIDCIHKVTIEKDVFFGHDTMILTGGHDPHKFGQERRVSYGGGPVTIHEGAWIATRAILVGPCEIGKHAVIGAGSVVRGKIPDYAIVIGNPGKVVKIIK